MSTSGLKCQGSLVLFVASSVVSRMASKHQGVQDPLKLHLGGLKVDVTHQDVMDFFATMGLEPAEVQFPPKRVPGATSVGAFACFWTEDEANRGQLNANGNLDLDQRVKAAHREAIEAHRGGHHMGVFFQVRSLGLL
jgi:hypothetical protein